MNSVGFILIVAFIALIYSAYLYFYVQKQDMGTEEMINISLKIRQGASAYLKRQYKSVGIFFAVVFILLFILSMFKFVYQFVPYAFLLGGALSALSGFIGMTTATMANVRTAAASRVGLSKGLKIAFSAGSVVGFVVVGFGLLGLGLWYFFLRYWFENISVLTSESQLVSEISANLLTFGMGVSCMSLFARVGGGIFTKAADVGADLVGKIEVGIPEDDHRNPATIADNVGDNVGDIAGMGADLYESFVTSIVSCSALSLGADFDMAGVLLPFGLAAGGVIVSLVGTFFVKATDDATQKDLLNSLRRGVYVSSILMLVVAYIVIKVFLPSQMRLLWPVLTGLISGILIGLSTEYFTSASYTPTKNLAKSSKTGAGTVIISGLSLGMLSTVLPVVIVCIAILISFFSLGGTINDNLSFNRGLYGIALSAVGMLSTLGITVATDAYGPIADNAGGIAEMAGLDPKVRERTDALDALGNTTAATGKGFSIASAALTALSLIAAYIGQAESLSKANPFNFTLLNPSLLIGLFLGSMIPYLFSAFTMDSVGKAAMSIVNEVRRQFTSMPGILEGTVEPDYQSCVDICAKTSIRYMMIPALIGVVVPIFVSFFLGVPGVAGMLGGATVSGFLLALMMANAGGAWDNAKKYIEAGHYGGKGSAEHKSAVVGDTVGDPFKDTSGPSINILLKLLSVVAIVFVGIAVSARMF